MRILNYNSAKHNIYLFDEQEVDLVLVGKLPPTPDEFSSKLRRQHQPAVGYNLQGLWSVTPVGSGISAPDWSGLHVRSRGSSLNTNNPPHHTYYKGVGLYQESAPYSDVLDINNWNNELPAFAMVSSKHFVACRHFIGFNNRAPQYIRLLGKNGTFVNKLGRLISNYQDTNLYELDIPLSEAELEQVKVYDIVNPTTVPADATFWHQGPNGSFNAYRSIQYGAAPPILQELNALYTEFPNASPTNAFPGEGPINQIWSGDSGSPILVTFNNQTYLYGFAYGWQIYGQSDMWSWLNGQLVLAGITDKELVNLSDPSVLASSTESNSNFKYRAGFLEEAAASSISFINPPATNQISFIKLSGPAELIENAYVKNIKINMPSTGSRKFECEVFSGDSELLFAPNDFGSASENFLAPNTVHGLVFSAENECYLSYAIRVNDPFTLSQDIPNYQYDSGDSDSYYLSPFALEPNTGDVFFNVDIDQAEPVALVPASSNSIIAFQEGYNYELETSTSDEVPTFNLSAVAGGGIGREPCDSPANSPNDGLLRSINGQTPNDMGGIAITSASAECVTVDSATKDNELAINSHCAPCCRCSDYTKTGKYIRSYATIYAELAKQYKALVEKYNNINQQFNNQASCCETFNIVNSRFKLWPQQNFMLQVQALMENNTKYPLCMCGVKLSVEAQVISDDGYDDLSEVEDILDSEGQVINTIRHSLLKNSYLTVTPLKEASYLYFKTVNPGSQALDVSMDDSEEAGSDKKRMVVQVNLQNGETPPIATPCDNPAAALPSNCMESCDGYLMLTAGMTISDPVFRRIVHLRKKRLGSGFDGVDVKVNIFFSYEGPNAESAEGNCRECVSGNWIMIPPQGVSRTVRMSANRKSVDPCAPVRIKSLERDPDTNNLVLAFTGTTSIQTGTAPTIQIIRRGFDGTDWVDLGSITRTITADDAVDGQIASISVNTDDFSGDVGSQYIALSYTATATGAGLVSKCYPNPNDPNYSVDVNVAPGTASYSRRL